MRANLCRRLIAGALMLLAGCATRADLGVRDQASMIPAISREAVACRARVAAQPRYRELATHLPLVLPLDASFVQMTDRTMATDDVVLALESWHDEIQTCRRQIARSTLTNFPTAIAALVAGWNKDDDIYVRLAERELSWGRAVMRIRDNHAEMLASVVQQLFQVSQQRDAERQAELSRRIALLGAMTNLAP